MSEHLEFETPVFIGGLSYSGKTQLRQLLAAKPHFSLQRRTGLWKYHGAFGDLAERPNRDRARSVMERDLVESDLKPDWDSVFDEFVERGDYSYARLFGTVQHQHAAASGRSRWGEQYGNIVNLAQQVFDVYPESRMLHMIRHPRGRLVRISEAGSRRRGWMGWETGAGVESLRLASRNTRRYPDRYMVVSYEELSGRTEDTIVRVCRFIGESPEEIIHSTSSGDVRFDDDAEGDSRAGSRAGEFAASAIESWPLSGASGNAAHGGASPMMLKRFPVDTMAMWYKLNVSSRGIPK